MKQYAILYSGILVEGLLEENYRMRGHVLSTEVCLSYMFFYDFWDISYRYATSCFSIKKHNKTYKNPHFNYISKPEFVLFIPSLKKPFGAKYLKFKGNYSKYIAECSLSGYAVW